MKQLLIAVAALFIVEGAFAQNDKMHNTKTKTSANKTKTKQAASSSKSSTTGNASSTSSNNAYGTDSATYNRDFGDDRSGSGTRDTATTKMSPVTNIPAGSNRVMDSSNRLMDSSSVNGGTWGSNSTKIADSTAAGIAPPVNSAGSTTTGSNTMNSSTGSSTNAAGADSSTINGAANRVLNPDDKEVKIKEKPGKTKIKHNKDKRPATGNNMNGGGR